MRRSTAVGMLALLVMAFISFTGTMTAGTYKTLYEFTGYVNGHLPTGGLVFDKAGNLYGTTVEGGTGANAGVVFKLSPNSKGTWTETVLYRFTGGVDGGPPNGDLIFDGAGNLYGTTKGGGTGANAGVVFKLSPNSDGSWTDTVLYSFTGGADGRSPQAGVILDAVGNIYGTTAGGGSNGNGTVFELSPDSSGTWTETVLYSSGSSGPGDVPISKLTFDAAGNLYGTMAQCVSGCYGTVFKLSPNSNGTWTYSALHAFTDVRDGRYPVNVIIDAAGNLYGVTTVGGDCGTTGTCGIVFKLMPNSNGDWAESVIHRFYTEAYLDVNPMSFDAAGNLYGTTFDGGFDNYGRVFELMPQSGGSWTYTVPRYFYGKPSENPRGDLVFDKAGNLYGATFQCVSGSNCDGGIFEITP